MFPRFLFGFPLVVLGTVLTVPQVMAQPDGTPRAMVPSAPIPPAPPLTLEEIQKLTGGPTQVTYSGKDVPTADVVKALLMIASQDVRDMNSLVRGAPATISVDWKDKPFWDAAREVEKLTGLRWSQALLGTTSLGTPGTVAGASLDGLLLADTPFVKIFGIGVTHTTVSDLRFEDGPNAVPPSFFRTQLRVLVYYDPKLKVENGSLEGFGVRLPDGAPQTFNNAISVNDRFAIRWEPPLIENLMIELPFGIKSGTTISKVTASARFYVSPGDKKWVVDDLLNAADAQETSEKSRFTVDGVKVNGSQLQVTLQVERDGIVAEVQPFALNMGNDIRAAIADGKALPGPAGAPIPAMLLNDVRLVAVRQPFRKDAFFRAFNGVTVRDSKGQVLNNMGRTSSGGGNLQKLTNTLTFNTTGTTGPYTLEWNLPSTPRSIEVPFELKDVRIP